ncbi:MAG TPA: FAD-binding oxidoreductase [Candidatus Acidoferrales bacterium]|nr:FAD-binding oxidoreductase [Candidatus Acidoferrales bacterium]
MSTPAKTMPSRAVEIVGAANFTDDPAQLTAYEVDGVRPSAAVRPGAAGEVAELVKLAVAEKLAVIPMGARTKLSIGMPPTRYDLAIDMTRLDRVISYDPGDLTLSAEAGISLAKLAATLAEHKQFLPLAGPFYERATIGGTLGSGVDSPLRQMYGTARDFVLGMEFVTGDGALAKSGGRVVKNVSGYDLHKLMLGAIGSLGVMTRVNFKTFPLAAETRGWLAGFTRAEDAFAFAHTIRKSPLAPQTLEIFDRSAAGILDTKLPIAQAEWSVAISAAGNERVLERSADDLQNLSRTANAAAFRALDGAAALELRAAIREFPALVATKFTDGVIVKFTALPTEMAETVQMLKTAATERGLPYAVFARGVGVIYFALLPTERDATTTTRLAQCAKEIISAAGKNSRGMILQSTLELKREANVWSKPGDDFPLMQRVKQAFDPHGIFAPGRFVGGL